MTSKTKLKENKSEKKSEDGSHSNNSHHGIMASTSKSMSESDHETHEMDIDEHKTISDSRNSVVIQTDDDGEEMEAEARALRQAIAEGAFSRFGPADNVLNKKRKYTETVDATSETNKDENGAEGSHPNSLILASKKALALVASDLIRARSDLPWPETLTIVPATSLPFGGLKGNTNSLDVHDDIKREVAFYNLALEAVNEARIKCEHFQIPFTRPEDFFCEMVKTDDHMAKIKDRLIFESKKINAFEQRKSNKEQKLRNKEAVAHRLEEKAKAKKNHLKEVENWAKSAAMNRPGGGKVRDDDDQFLDKMSTEPNKKRIAANKKYGFGGKKPRFKQMGQKSINDMSQFNPRGNFSGGGSKKTRSVKGKRPGKRTRDASKSRR